MSNRATPLTSILVGVAFFLSAVYFSGAALRFLRIDATEDELYTLSEGAEAILGRIDEPIILRLFYSEEKAPDIGLDNFGRRVKELLAEFEQASNGKLVVQVISPEQYSEEEELASSLGVRGQMVSAQGDLFFFGIAATNSVDDLETIPALNPTQENFLEYELAKLISKLSNPDLPKVAVLSGLPIQGAPAANPFGGPPEPGWRVVDVLRESFEVEFLAEELTEPIDGDVDALLIVHPKDLSPSTRYAIDQYALGGGKVCALVDPFCWGDQPPPQMQRGPVDNASRLDDLLASWGVDLVPGTVVGDLGMAQVVRARSGLIPFPVWMELNGRRDAGVFNSDDVVTSAMNLVTMLTAGELRATEEASTTFTPLIRTTTGGRGVDGAMLPPDLLSAAGSLFQSFLLHAEGSIEFTGTPEDGASLTLSDGLRAPVTFEFDADGTVAEGNTAVALPEDAGPEGAAQALRMQLMLANLTATEDSGLGIEASGMGARVELMAQEAGPQGEVDIRRSGRLEAEVEGMVIQGQPKTVAARLQGRIATAFPEGAPAEWTGDAEHLADSTGDFNAIVVADADFVHEQFWQSQVQQGGFVMQRMNDNPTVLVNALENLCGSNDLLSLRSRGIERRPFAKKEELNRQADERFRAKADELRKVEQKLNAEISELQAGADDSGVVRISTQELEELRDKQQELAETRSELGRVEGDRKKELKALGTRLFALNIVLPPALVIALGLLYGLSAAARRKSK